MKHQPLIQETIVQLAGRFTAKVSEIKKGIDSLLDRECEHMFPLSKITSTPPSLTFFFSLRLANSDIERVEGQRDLFSYLA